jgi:hypothetical protein
MIVKRPSAPPAGTPANLLPSTDHRPSNNARVNDATQHVRLQTLDLGGHLRAEALETNLRAKLE